MDVRDIWNMRSAFWNFDMANAPTTSQRNEQITEKLKFFLNPVAMKFDFSVQKKNGSYVPVCERAFMIILGYKSLSSQWSRCKVKVLGQAAQQLTGGRTKTLTYPRAKARFERAKAWIRDYATQQADN